MKKLIITNIVCLSLMVLLIPSLVFSATFIQVKGSDTEVNLVQRLAESFMKKNPNYSVAVTGGRIGGGDRGHHQ